MGACNRLGKDNNAAPFFFFIFEGYLHSTTAINKRQTIPIHLKLVYLGICPPQSRHWAVSLLALSPRTIIEMGRTKFCPFFYLNSISSKQKTERDRAGVVTDLTSALWSWEVSLSVHIHQISNLYPSPIWLQSVAGITFLFFQTRVCSKKGERERALKQLF